MASDGTALTETGGKLDAAIVCAAHDDCNVNANMQIANTDVATGNPVPVVFAAAGSHANCWDADTIAANDVSPSVDLQYTSAVSLFGQSLAGITLTVQVSQDNTAWYDSTNSVYAGGGTDFYAAFTTGARYARLKTSDACTITATIAGKP